MNLYDILEVSNKASKEVIEKAYRVLCKKYHPDLQEQGDRDQAEEMMKKLNEAYYTLIDDSKRAEYDNKLLNEQEHQQHYNHNERETNHQESNYNANQNVHQNTNFNQNINYDAHNNAYNNISQHAVADNWRYKNVIDRDLVMMVFDFIAGSFRDKHKIDLMVDEYGYQKLIEYSQEIIKCLWHDEVAYVYVPHIYKNYDLETTITRELFERLVEFYSTVAEEQQKKEKQKERLKNISAVVVFVIVAIVLLFSTVGQMKHINLNFFKVKL